MHEKFRSNNNRLWLFGSVAFITLTIYLCLPFHKLVSFYLLSEPGSPISVFYFHLTNFLYYGLFFFLYRILFGSPPIELFKCGTLKQATQCLLGVIILFLLFKLYLKVSGDRVSIWELNYVLGYQQKFFVAINSLFIVPLSEEIFFRAILIIGIMNFIYLLYSPFRWRFSIKLAKISLITAILASSIFFACMHKRGLVYSVYFSLLGTWFGYWAYVTRGLIVPIIAHAVAASLAVGTLYYQYSGMWPLVNQAG